MTQACLGLAGEVKGLALAGARCGIAGLNDLKIVSAGMMATDSSLHAIPRAGLGIAGNLGAGARLAAQHQIIDPSPFKRRDASLAALSKTSRAIGDQAARSAWSKAVWFADYSYLVKPDHRGGLTWKKGRDSIFYQQRDIPLFIDSSGYRREISGTAPAWVRQPSTYPAAIELIQPDGYASYDYPDSRERSMRSLHELKRTFPADITNGHMWPVFSIRWAWNDAAYFDAGAIPSAWNHNLAALIPMNRTQRPIADATREAWARLAIANALALRDDPDFTSMCAEFGHVMLGGLIKSPCPRAARHLYAATLCHVFPGVQFWLLGQANFSVINGLGRFSLLDRCFTDGSWWILESTQSKLALLDGGLLTMLNLRSRKNEAYSVQHFLSTVKIMSSNLRALLAAYQGLWTFPAPDPLPMNLADPDERRELKKRVQAAQLELNFGDAGRTDASDDPSRTN